MSALASLFRRTWYSTRGLRRIAERHSRFKAAFIGLFVLAFEVGLFVLFAEGFQFLSKLGGIGLVIIRRLFSLFFLGLSFMLVISSIITSYAALYRSEEIPFLSVRPYSTSQIVLAKFLESCLLSSWAFFFVIIPFVGAYAQHEDLSPFFSLWTLLFSLPFVVVCSGCGTLISMLIVRFAPRGRTLKRLVTCFAVAVLAAVVWAVGTAQKPSDETALVLSSLIPGLRLSSYPLLPSWWVSEGIISLTRGQWVRGPVLWAVVCANALMMCLVVERLGIVIFNDGLQRMRTGSGRSRRGRILFGRLERILSPCANDIRALIMKDVRVFFRDPLQWSQFLIFFGLLGIYFASLRSFQYDRLDDMWRSLITFLNIFSIATVMCSLSSRFIYPQLSLEGQGFWVLGLAPTTMGRILMSKFIMSFIGMATISCTLMYLSTEMLRVDAAVQFIAMSLALAISLAVSGMSTGLGAVFIDLKQRNPAAIVSGFGGTLNLVLSLAYMLLVVVPFAAVFHLSFLGTIDPRSADTGIALAVAWLVFLSILSALIPLRLGRRHLASRDY